MLPARTPCACEHCAAVPRQDGDLHPSGPPPVSCAALLTALAPCRVLVNKARVEAQSFRLRFDEQIRVDALTRYIAGRVLSLIIAQPSGPDTCT